MERREKGGGKRFFWTRICASLKLLAMCCLQHSTHPFAGKNSSVLLIGRVGGGWANVCSYLRMPKVNETKRKERSIEMKEEHQKNQQRNVPSWWSRSALLLTVLLLLLIKRPVNGPTCPHERERGRWTVSYIYATARNGALPFSRMRVRNDNQEIFSKLDIFWELNNLTFIPCSCSAIII